MDRPVIIADDLQLFRQGLRDLLTLEGCEVVAEAGDGAEAVETAVRHPEATLLLDLRLPGMDGFEVLAEMKAKHVPNPVIMLTAHWTNELLFRALVAGAAGYVAKDCEVGELTAAIDLAGYGGIALSSAVVEDFEAGIAVTRTLLVERRLRELGLTERERELLEYLPGALSLSQIAETLFVSRKTVQNNVSSLYRKLGVTSRSEAVMRAMELHLLAEQAPSQRARSLRSSHD
jgi:DNA-binding NarL/FixJ family response regulator